MELRDYQSRTVADVMSDSARVCVVAPTGAGKTCLGSAVASNYKSVCWVAHRKELIEQARAALQLWAPHTQRTVVTVQSIRQPSSHHYDLLIVDEAHHYAAEDWQHVTTHVKHTRLVGLTATPERRDGKGLASVFDRLVVAATYSELLDRRLLVPCRLSAPAEDTDDGIGARPLKAWLDHGDNRLTLAFAPSIELAEKWNDEFKAAGISSETVFGKTDNRSELLQRFRVGTTRVVWNVAVLTEGFDVPAVGCILLARKVRTTGLYLQIVGRGLRTADGKDHVRIIDLGGNYRVHGWPTDDREYSLGDDKQLAISKPEMERWRQCKRCGGLAKVWQKACPLCGSRVATKHFALRILNRELIEVYEADMTPAPVRSRIIEHLRAEQLRGEHDITWLVRTYKKLFGRVPQITFPTTPGERQAYYRWLNRFMKPEVSKHVFRRVFGTFPASMTSPQQRAAQRRLF